MKATLEPLITVDDVDLATIVMDECPQGGSHAPIPKQGGGSSVCAKCNSDC